MVILIYLTGYKNDNKMKGYKNGKKMSVNYIEANIGDKIVLKCNSIIVPGHHPTTWIFNNGPIYNLPYFQGPSSIQLYPIHFNHSGIYTCFGLELLKFHMKKEFRYFIATTELIVYGE